MSDPSQEPGARPATPGRIAAQAPAAVFLFGTLRDPQLAEIVAGAPLATEPATVEGQSVRPAAAGDWPVMTAEPGAAALGDLARVTPDMLERMNFYEALFGYSARSVSVGLASGRTCRALAWFPDAPQPTAPGHWDLAEWQASHGPLARAAADDALAARADQTVETIARRWPMMRARAQARLNARASAPTRLRRATGPGDVEIHARRVPYAAFFAVEDYELRHARFGGGMSDVISRSAFVSADAVTVLPYDPVRDNVLLIEQFRAGPLARGDRQCWLLEAIAGRIDAGERPEEAAHREAREEAGLTLDALIPLAGYYPSPGAKTEFLHSFLALAELPETAARLGGVADEHEDIRGHVVSFDAFMELMATGEIANAPLLLSGHELKSRRAALRAAAGASDASAR